LNLPVYPFDADRCIGTVIEVSGTTVRVNLPQAAAPGSRWHHGFNLEAGRVGEFVVIEAGETAVFGRVTAVRLPERERLSVEEEFGSRDEVHPIGIINMMASASLVTGRIEPGVPNHPRLAARCFSAHPELVKWLAEHSKFLENPDEAKLIDLAVLPFALETQIRLAPESLFGRHCAILGATGGGKSWTVARIVEQAAKHRSKILLIDPTGEYHRLTGSHVSHVHVNKDDEATARGSVEVALPHKHLTEEDFFALFTPSPQNQQPRLRSAIKSLKIAFWVEQSATRPDKYGLTKEAWDEIAKLGQCCSDGLMTKAGKKRGAFENAVRALGERLDRTGYEFAANRLAEQINLECCDPTGKTDGSVYGDVNTGEQGYCTTLILRVEQHVASAEHACLFRVATKADLIATSLKTFLESDEKSLLVLSLKNLSFSNHLREIFVNAIGRTLLLGARHHRFKQKPLVVVLDEAHQFIGRTVGDDFSRFPLDAFELIAKEGRKYGLTVCLATQRPRDIGQGILSQMGTFLVHRLTNPEDRDIVEKAAGDLDRSAASFIPTLSAGQAVLIGIDFPIPVTLQIQPPEQPPESTGPRYQDTW
jgi:energy-coupling factor transporter ATP-binding protein EcfA2